MESDEESPTHIPQCPAGSEVGRRNVEVKNEDSNNDRVDSWDENIQRMKTPTMTEWTVGMRTSKPKMSIELSSSVCKDKEPGMAHLQSDDEQEDDSDRNYGPRTVYAKVKSIQHGKDKGTAAVQTQMPSSKPKARISVACRQPIDGSEAASLRDQSHLPLPTLKGALNLAITDPTGKASVHTSFAENASTSGAQQESVIKDPRLNLPPHNNTEDTKRQYNRELSQQIEERRQLRERERRRNTTDEHKHNDTMQHSIWGMPGSGAPNYHLGTVKRTKSLYAAGIIPQEQIDRGLRGNPLQHNIPKPRQRGTPRPSGRYTL